MNVSITPGQRRGAAAALRSLGRTTMPVVAIVGTVADAYGGRPDASPVESLADLVDWPTCRIGYVPGSADEGVCLHHARGRLAVARQLAAAWAGEGEPDGDGD